MDVVDRCISQGYKIMVYKHIRPDAKEQARLLTSLSHQNEVVLDSVDNLDCTVEILGDGDSNFVWREELW